MAVGFPSISDPRENDWRGLQGAIRNIRERITQVEGLLTSTQAQANQSTSSITTLQSLTRLVAQLAARLAALEAAAAGSQTVRLTAGAPIALDDPVVMISRVECAPVDVGDPLRIYAVVGIATNAAAIGGSVVVQTAGLRDLSYGSFTAGKALYAGLEGLTEDPSYGTLAIPIGVATGAQSMWVEPAFPRLQYPGVYEETEQYLPITWGLFQGLVPRPDSPVATIGFQAVDGIDDTHFTRADGAPALGTTLVTPGADSFSLSTASDPGGTTARGNIVLTTGDNDTFLGCSVSIGGAQAAGNGPLGVTAGGPTTLTSESLSVTVGDWSLYLNTDAGIESSGGGDLYLTAGGSTTFTSPGGVAFFGENFQMLTVGSGIDIAEGSNARMGLDTLSSGSVTVNTTAVATNSRVFLTAQNSGSIAAPAALEISARVDGTSFTISSADPADDRDVAWLIFAPG